MCGCDILQWNCKGLRTRLEELKVLLRESNPGVICLQETKLGPEVFNPGLNYNIFSSAPRAGDRTHGGAAIDVHKSLQHSPLPIVTDLQAVALTVVLDKQITICSIYLPPRAAFTNADIQSLLDQLPSPFLLLGDFNAHNPLWGGDILDSEGKVIEDIINNNNVVLLNDGTMTYHNLYFNSYSAIDLSICSSDIALDFNWSVSEYLNGSDHFPIHLKFARNVPTETPPKWKPLEADWANYKEGIKLVRSFESFDCHLEAYTYFTDVMLASAESSIPKTTGKSLRPAVPWWDKQCGTLRKIARRCYKKIQIKWHTHI